MMPVWALLSAVQGPAGSGRASSLLALCLCDKGHLLRESGFPGVGVRPPG